MKFVLVPSHLMLLSAATVWSEPSHVVNLIHRLNEFFCFDHNIFLLNSGKDVNRHVRVNDKNETPKTVFIYGHNYLNIERGTQRRQLEALTTTSSKNSFVIVVVAGSIEFRNDTEILDVVIAIRQLMVSVKIGFFIENNNNISMENVLQLLFEWSLLNGIVNIFVHFTLTLRMRIYPYFDTIRFKKIP